MNQPDRLPTPAALDWHAGILILAFDNHLDAFHVINTIQRTVPANNLCTYLPTDPAYSDFIKSHPDLAKENLNYTYIIITGTIVQTLLDATSIFYPKK